MPLSIGSRLGPYEIVSAIGAGGMGEVYRARDTNLGRDVAIKVLPDAFARDPDRMARFGREAKLLAAVNHSNIASIYGLETSGDSRALVMELAEGPTLADRIAQGPIPIEDTLRIAKQICEALEYAHEKGIVHRDLKPANIKVAADDTVKILDFGLAKAMESEAASFDISTSPTISRMATQAGILLGTAAYMSPEQAKAKPVDRRADIWAFGCVFYEMLTGKKAFEGDTVADTLGAITRAEPDWTKFPVATPMRVRVLLQRCLQKDLKQRLQAIGDARISLEEVLSGAPEPSLVGASSVSVPLWRRALPWALFAATACALVVLAFIHFREKYAIVPRAVQRFEIAAPNSNVNFVGTLSPDGTRWVIGGPTAGVRSRLWLRRMNSLEARPIEGTEGTNGIPFWSPDSRFIVFGTQDGKLKKVDTEGGPAQVLCDSGGYLAGGFWTPNGKIIFSNPGRGLFEVSAAGGVPSPLSGLDHPGRVFPVLLPDGRHFLYSVGTPQRADVYLGSLDSQAGQRNNRKVLTGVLPRTGFAPSPDDPNVGYVLYIRGTETGASTNALMAQSFDLRKLSTTGVPVPVAQGVSAGNFSASSTGTLIYGSRAGIALNTQPTLFDRQGKVLGAVGELGVYHRLAFSPDATRVVAGRLNFQSGGDNLWMIDLVRGISTRFTFDSGVDRFPVWSPDGNRVIFASNREGSQNLYEKLSNGGGNAELLLKSDGGVVPVSWSGDGRFLLFGGGSSALSFSDEIVSVLPLDRDGHAAGKPFPFVQKGVGIEEKFSPGPQGHPRWVAYASKESGRFEVYVRPFDPKSPTGTPPGGGKWQVSTEGGTSPRWNSNGKELFYVALDGTVMSAKVSGTTLFQSGIPKPLFKPKRLAPQPDGEFNWDASSNGKEFVFSTIRSANGGAAPTVFTAVLNWPSLLKK